MHYIDGFVVAVPDDQRDIYVRYGGEAARVFKEYGALRVVECWGDDVPTTYWFMTGCSWAGD